MRPLPCHPGPRLYGILAAVLLALASPAAVAEAAADGGKPDQSFTIKDPRITESSGLAASRIHPGIYWTHNDSDDGPYVFAVDSRTGETVATITMSGIGEPRDVEAISLGPDGDLYVGDIGDNFDGAWDHVWIYRFPEPKQLRDATVRATQYVVKYADGPRNAESLMVHPKTGRVYIASKNEKGGGLYEGPATLSVSGTNIFRRIGEVPWVTDGAFSPDGGQLVLRSYFSARGYAWKNGRLGADFAVSAPFQGQAESVTYTADGSALMFGSEGAQSDVKRVNVDRPAGSDNSSDGKGGSMSGGSGDGSTAGNGTGGNGSSGGSGADDGPDKGSMSLGALVLLGAAVLFFGFKGVRKKK
ncbi:WD40 repeat domain-containing protein [Streptomyces sp. NPDC088725]|uniref:WD40 repeat domain-containing protein n=1 Tax=Streptomyces sp. NPDC088725 TaxID=3365873 RepID=UPI00381A094C